MLLDFQVNESEIFGFYCFDFWGITLPIIWTWNFISVPQTLWLINLTRSSVGRSGPYKFPFKQTYFLISNGYVKCRASKVTWNRWMKIIESPVCYEVLRKIKKRDGYRWEKVVLKMAVWKQRSTVVPRINLVLITSEADGQSISYQFTCKQRALNTLSRKIRKQFWTEGWSLVSWENRKQKEYQQTLPQFNDWERNRFAMEITGIKIRLYQSWPNSIQIKIV